MTVTAVLAGRAMDRRSLRQLAASGELWRADTAAPAEISQLRSEAFEIALPLVWERHTRPLELRKGHRDCFAAIRCLKPECLDGFTDDLEAVVAALMAYRRPIASLEGWITTRMANAIKDGYRVRRAREMGAQQRVRVPVGVAKRLRDDPWLLALTERVLQWTGLRQAAGMDLWPFGQWADDRAEVTGTASSRACVAADISRVLAVMREWDAAWYDRYVETPLGRKWAPVASGRFSSLPDADYAAEEDLPLDLVPAYERTDARLIDAATACLDEIRAGLATGDNPRTVIEEAIVASYLTEWTPGEIDQVPAAEPDISDVIQAIVADPRALDRVVLKVLDIVVLEHAVPPQVWHVS
jgi:hypothetical protein